ncbi:MAG TPA: hypothetical protein VF590_22440, partial [Isosphaeraceae bacterium]
MFARTPAGPSFEWIERAGNADPPGCGGSVEGDRTPDSEVLMRATCASPGVLLFLALALAATGSPVRAA